MEKEPLIISFSGGASSAYMSHCLMHDDAILAQYKPYFIFANTGLEHEKTLEFVRNCEIHYGWKIVWVEAVVNPEKGKGTRHKVVNFDTAARDGSPFRDVVAKYTLPNIRFKHCTRELKISAINSWCRENLGKSNLLTAIGIRADESHRAKSPANRKLIYPLVDRYPSTKSDVKTFWETQPFQLGLPEHLGNCIPCFEKSDEKLRHAYRDSPNQFFILEQLEHEFPCGQKGQPVFFFRKNRVMREVITMY